jgi:hypothetical protein
MNGRSPSQALDRSVAGELAAIADRLSHRMLDVTTPVYRTERGKPVSEGTGVLFALGEIRFLLTAAHVLEHLQDGGLTAQAGQFLGYIGGEVTRLYSDTGARSDEDLVDIRIVRLVGRDWLEAPIDRFLRWDELDHFPARPERHAFALVGYPWTKQPDRPNGTTMEAYAYRVLGLECESTVYKRLSANPDVALLIGFDKRQTWGPEGQVTAPDLYGVSGCGLWRFGRRIREAVYPPRLSAIGIRWERQGKVKHIRGTRIRPIIAAIGRRYSDARSIIERHLVERA